MKVYKYELAPVGQTRLEVPVGAMFLHLDIQKGKPHVWLAVDVAETKRPFIVKAVPTGGDVSPRDAHLGTLLFNGGEFVVHYFEEPS